MKEWIALLKTRWANFSKREQLAIALAGLVIGIFMVYELLWSPYVNHMDALRAHIQTEQKSLQWMQAADQEIKQKEQAMTNQKPATSLVTLLGVIQDKIDHAQLRQFLTQLKQASNDSIEIHFQKIAFDQLMNFLLELSREQPVVITQVSAVAENTAGTVSAEVSLSL